MRNIVITSLAIISIAVFSYRYIVNDNSSTAALVVNSQGSHVSSGPLNKDMQKKIDTLTNEVTLYYSNNSKQIQQMQMEQARLSESLLALNNHLEDLQKKTEETYEIDFASNRIENSEELASNSSAASEVKSENISEGDFGKWIDKTIDLGDFDANLSAVANEQASVSIAELSNVSLGDLRCGQKVCRAALSRENGEDAPVHELFGKPPFDTEGFTVEKEDGSVLVYFTQPGVSIDELRLESLQVP